MALTLPYVVVALAACGWLLRPALHLAIGAYARRIDRRYPPTPLPRRPAPAEVPVVSPTGWAVPR